MSKSLEDYLSIIPIEYRTNLFILEDFKGNRTSASFKFQCGCETKQPLKAILNLKRFDYCFYCLHKFVEKFLCKYCQTEFINYKMYDKCANKCRNKYINLIENKDFVICQICGFHSKSLGTHLNKKHNLSSKDYEKQFPGHTAITKISHDNYARVIKENGTWLQNAIKDGRDLTEYKEKMSQSVSQYILNNPKEKIRRAEVMTKVNQSDLMKQKASETAIKTSARQEILQHRSEQLKKWRENNPEDFHEKCIKAMINSFQSKPEKKLFEFISNLDGFSFKRNQFIKNNSFTSSSHKRQIDMIDINNRIYIEFDGQFHFIPVFGDDVLNDVKERENEVELFIKNNNYILIRISYDQFIYKSNQINKEKIDTSYFRQECLDKLVEILNNKITGIYKIGIAYGQH